MIQIENMTNICKYILILHTLFIQYEMKKKSNSNNKEKML